MKNSEDIMLCENSKYKVTHTLWSQLYKMTQKQTRELNKGKEVELVGDFSFFHLAIVSGFSIIDTHYFYNEYNSDTNGN